MNIYRHLNNMYLKTPIVYAIDLAVDGTGVYEPQHDTTNKMTCAPNEDSDQPGRPLSLIRVFPVRMKKPKVLGYP